MKIAISSVGKEGQDLFDARFGRCEYFQIYDTESNEVKVIENKGKTSGGGAGIAAAQQILDEKVDIVITGNLGPNAFLIIEKADIQTLRAESGTVLSVLEKYQKGELFDLSEAGPAHFGMGNGFKGGR